MTAAADITHGQGPRPGRVYCGRASTNTAPWQYVACADCRAAYRADGNPLDD